jgi:lipopolysaccharide export system protein LptA
MLSMRGTRWLLILAILGILGGVGVTYRLQKRILASQAPEAPAKMPPELTSQGEDWVWSKKLGSKNQVELRATNFRQEKDSGLLELEGVRLRIFSKDGDSYNYVKCSKAQFSQSERRLYSEGDVEITMNLPVAGAPKKKPVCIRTTGLSYESETGKASTGRVAYFEFENGHGRATGASYDPGAKLLHLYHQVEVNWKSRSPNAKPMKVESEEMTYQEGSGKIWLAPWAKLTRENAVMETEAAVVTLEDGVVSAVEANKGHGTDSYPNRKLEYAADQLWVNFTDRGQVQKVMGEPNAHLVNSSDSSVTTLNARHVDLDFADINSESVLTHVAANGGVVAESKPLAAPGKAQAETRVLRSDIIDMKMRAGGKEIDAVEVPVPGTLEFLPNRPADRHRIMTGSHMWIAYSPQNHIQSFRTVDATTQTDPTAEESAHKREGSKTSSKNLTAQFDPKTGQMSRLEQWEDFIYQEGDRNARAAKAVLEQQQNMITLETGAKMWDATGSTLADRIRLDQKSGNFEAEGHVTSSRLPEQKKPGSDLLATDEPLQAVAERMQSANRNRLVSYQGKVVLWQGANRIKAQQVTIDREKRRLTAVGDVMTQFIDEPKDENGQPKKGVSPVFTVVNAKNLLYTEENRLADYTGGVTLTRPGLDVKGDQIRAFLAEKGADNRLDKAYADGKVTIQQKTPVRTRTGTGEHAEYYTEDERIVLRGGAPQLADTLRGNTRGAELTYFADDDRLLVNGAPAANGAPAKPAASRVKGKKTK